MEYKYPPIYKYTILMIIIYSFIKHQHIMPIDKLLFNTLTIILLIISLDFILIKNHTYMFDILSSKTNIITEHFTSKSKSKSKKVVSKDKDQGQSQDLDQDRDLDQDQQMAARNENINELNENENINELNEDDLDEIIDLCDSKYELDSNF